jgi:hypothetical protein
MKLSTNTINILKNFASINQGVYFRGDKPVYTKTVGNSLLAKCDFGDESFGSEFAVYDLTSLLQVYSLFNEPDLQFKDNYILLKSGGATVKYYYSAPEVVNYPTDDEIDGIESISKDLSESFILTSEDLDAIKKASAVMKLDVVKFVSDGKTVTAILEDSQHTTNNTYSLELGDANHEFSVGVFVDNLKILTKTYVAHVSDNFIYLDSDNLSYWIALIEE